MAKYNFSVTWVFADVESFFFHHLEKGKIVTEIYML